MTHDYKMYVTFAMLDSQTKANILCLYFYKCPCTCADVHGFCFVGDTFGDDVIHDNLCSSLPKRFNRLKSVVIKHSYFHVNHLLNGSLN